MLGMGQEEQAQVSYPTELGENHTLSETFNTGETHDLKEESQ